VSFRVLRVVAGLSWSLTATLSLGCGDRAPQRSGDSTGTAGLAAVDTARDSSVTALITVPLRALGNEPFWAVDVDSAGLRFITPDDTSGIRFPSSVPTSAGDTAIWMAENERTAIEVRIWRERCSDGMSDQIWPYTAQVRIHGTTYRGCADGRR